jgi:hypothetical protein
VSDIPTEPQQPLLRVVRGEPTAEELAALVAVVAARATSAAAEQTARRTAPRSRWNDPARLTRPPILPGPGGWRASALPR